MSDTPRLQYYDVQTLEYSYISKLIISPFLDSNGIQAFMHICRLCTTIV
jgi:hypothetical protein